MTSGQMHSRKAVLVIDERTATVLRCVTIAADWRGSLLPLFRLNRQLAGVTNYDKAWVISALQTGPGVVTGVEE